MRLRPGTSNPSRSVRVIKKTVSWAAIAVVLAVAIAAGTLWLQASRMKISGAEGRALASLSPKPDLSEGVTVLLVGSDRREDWVTARADSIQVLRLYPDDKVAYLLSIPRDTRVEIPGRGLDKINYSLTYGGPSLITDTVQNFLGTEVNYYIQVEYVGFERAIDQIGGIVYPIEKGWYSGEFATNVYPGTRRRMGRESLAILKSRFFPLGDTQRVQNQQRFVQAAGQQVLKSPSDLLRMVSVMSDYTKTNMGVLDVVTLGRAFVGGDIELRTASIPGSTGMYAGAAYSWPDRQATDKLVAAMKSKQRWD